jgi:FKBP-type peptidyl-prolyl cis-trans isomerase FkpA
MPQRRDLGNLKAVMLSTRLGIAAARIRRDNTQSWRPIAGAPAVFTFQESSIMRFRTRGIAPVAAVLLAASIAVHAAPAHKPTAPKASVAARSALSNDRQKLGYALGMKLGHDLGFISPISSGDVDASVVAQAANAMLTQGKTELAVPDAQAQLKIYGDILQARADALQAKKPAPANKPVGAQRRKIGYAIGMQIGDQFGSTLDRFKNDMDRDAFVRGFNAMASNGKTAMTVEEARATLDAFNKVVQTRQQAEQDKHKAEIAKLGQKNLADGAAFLAANAKKPGVKLTASGLQYMVGTMGTGAKPKPTDRVKVNYAGTLLDGTEFDSSAKNGGPIVMPLDSVIPGWTEGLQLMPVGSKFVFWIPGKLAYGERGAPPAIGPNATLKFEIELLSIEK